jgi:hypothetical protein
MAVRLHSGPAGARGGGRERMRAAIRPSSQARVRIAPIFLACVLALSAEAQAQAPIEIRDSSVDALPDVRVPVSPDLVFAIVDARGANLTFRFRFRPGSFDRSTTRLEVDLDIDQNPATGTAGVEYQLIVAPARDHADVVQTIKPSLTGTRTSAVLVGTVLVSSDADGCEVNIPRRLLGDDDGRFDFRVRVFADPLTTTVLDVLPDVGFVRLQ